MYIHYSKKLFSKMYNVNQEPGVKPTGLWFSVGDAWKVWCEEEEYNTDYLKYQYKIYLDLTNILYLKSTKDILEFTEEYKKSINDWSTYIDWKRVANKYKGIIISPYNCGLRLALETTWYYGWDVPSGCIWDKKTILDISIEKT